MAAVESVEAHHGLRDPVVRGLVEGAAIAQRLRRSSVVVVDIGFGLEFGGLATVDTAIECRGHAARVVALAADPGICELLMEQLPERRDFCEQLRQTESLRGGWGTFTVCWGDPRRSIFRLRGHADVVMIEPRLLDGHAQLFTTDFLRRAAWLLTPDGVIVTPVGSAACRHALHRIGLFVGSCAAELIPGGGTMASWSRQEITDPLDSAETAIVTGTLSGVPLRDPRLTWSRQRILAHREAVVARLRERGWPRQRG